MSGELKPAPSRRSSGDGARRPRVLIVEDDALIGLYEERTLSALGYEVERATNAREALRLAGEAGAGHDLVLMDIDLGEGMDGIEAAFELRKYSEAPILFLSSMSEAEVAARAEGLGAWSFFPKGVGAAALARRIEGLLGGGGSP
jgi:DNA-binding response OmpR family regulator